MSLSFDASFVRLQSSPVKIIIAALALAITLLSGCSALRIGYSQAPDLVYWWIDSYIDFDSNQTPRAREVLDEWFAWHRRTQLPDYAELLVRGEKEALADTTPARVCEWQREIVRRARTAYEHIEPAAAEIALTISSEQIQHLEKRYAKNNAEFRDEYLQKDARRRAEHNLKRTLERAEMLYGRLEDAQRNRIAEALTRSPFDPDQWLDERKQRQQDALRVLRELGNDSAATPAQAAAALRGYVDRIERSPRDPYRQYSERLMEFNCNLAASVHNMTTPAQRRNAVKKLAGYEADVRSIVAQGNR